ncbi:MFS transporter [Streptomyces chartreusis]|uniref:MFS transporter n=1 Tax=Streptomyces chartreusis TaxID=1969 RepID=UPI003821B18B
MISNVLANRDARLYVASQILSTLGSRALWLALGISVQASTGSPSAAGMVFFMVTLGAMFGPLGGMIADRVRRRRLLIYTNLVSAALVLLLLFAHDGTWVTFLIMFGYGLSFSLLSPAETAFVRTTFPSELLPDINAFLESVESTLRLIAPLAGAGLYSILGAGPVIIADAATFVLTALILPFMRAPDRRPEPPQHHWLTELTRGIRHIATTSELRHMAGAGAVTMAAFGLSAAVVFEITVNGLQHSVSYVGVLLAAQGAGAAVAAPVAARLVRRVGETRLVCIALLAATCGYLLQAISSVPPVLAGCVLAGASIPWFSVGTSTLAQRATPPQFMGRVGGAIGILFSAPQALAIAAGAALIAVISYKNVLLLMACLTGLSLVFLLTRRRVTIGPPRDLT